MLLSVVLYGSRARGDHRATSDTDLLGVIENGPIRTEIANSGTSLYHYPLELLRGKALRGDLFVLHLVSEGKILHDTAGVFGTVKRSFNLKSSYEDEIISATLIAKFFSTRTATLSRKDARKRLVWALRTILIARSAEQKIPIFSSAGLEAFSGISGLKNTIDSRHKPIAVELQKLATRILARFGSSSGYEWPDDKAGQRALLKERGGIAADTLRFVGPLARRNVLLDPAIEIAASGAYPG